MDEPTQCSERRQGVPASMQGVGVGVGSRGWGWRGGEAAGAEEWLEAGVWRKQGAGRSRGRAGAQRQSARTEQPRPASRVCEGHGELAQVDHSKWRGRSGGGGAGCGSRRPDRGTPQPQPPVLAAREQPTLGRLHFEAEDRPVVRTEARAERRAGPAPDLAAGGAADEQAALQKGTAEERRASLLLLRAAATAFSRAVTLAERKGGFAGLGGEQLGAAAVEALAVGVDGPELDAADTDGREHRLDRRPRQREERLAVSRLGRERRPRLPVPQHERRVGAKGCEAVAGG